jgi:hypothetical protein
MLPDLTQKAFQLFRDPSDEAVSGLTITLCDRATGVFQGGFAEGPTVGTLSGQLQANGGIEFAVSIGKRTVLYTGALAFEGDGDLWMAGVIRVVSSGGGTAGPKISSSGRSATNWPFLATEVPVIP